MNEKAIICVDDERIILDSLGRQLSKAFGTEYLIETASSGIEALELFNDLVAEKVAIPLIISDQNMRGISGDQLLAKLHQLCPESLKILLTGQTTDPEIIRTLVNQSALYRYITKPWDSTDLILTVREALRCYEQKQQLITQNDLLLSTNRQLEESLTLLIATLEATADGILVIDNQGKVIRCNQKFFKLWGIEGDSDDLQLTNHIVNQALAQLTTPYLCHLENKADFLAQKGYSLLELRNGKFLECYSQKQSVQVQGFSNRTVWSFRDVTARQQAEAIIKHQAFHDTLTGLANRSLFEQKLAEALTKSQHNQQKCAVMFFDLDRFKTINDTLGHAIGDRLLQEVVQRLLKCVDQEDTISRWGGDEFTLLLSQIGTEADTAKVAKNILQALQAPFKLKDYELHITSSIGIAICPDHGQDSDTLLKNADIALYKAKDRGRNNYQHYNQTLNSQGDKLLKLDNYLRYALEKHEFVLYYQPIIDIFTGKIAKMEALLRWQHPQLGLIAPGTFIPLAEENGLIVPIGEWVLEQACLQNKVWLAMGYDSLQISVNLSARQFQEPDIITNVLDIIKRSQLNPQLLELEITETVTMQNGTITKQILSEFTQLGISLAMDDFGTGYSSLSYLKQFPFSTLKIDRSFIQDSLTNPQDREIIKAIINLGKGLNISIVAEGIETDESKDFLQSLGCRYMQGYYFSRPVSAEYATSLLEQQNSVAY